MLRVFGIPGAAVDFCPVFAAEQEARLDTRFQRQSVGDVEVGQDRNIQVVQPVVEFEFVFGAERALGDFGAGTLARIQNIQRNGEPFGRPVFGESADHQRGFRAGEVIDVVETVGMQVRNVYSDFGSERERFLSRNGAGSDRRYEQKDNFFHKVVFEWFVKFVNSSLIMSVRAGELSQCLVFSVRRSSLRYKLKGYSWKFQK